MNQALLFYSLVLDILCVTYFMLDPQNSDMRE